MLKNPVTRIALVEDNAVNRNTFQQKAQQNADWKIVFVATNGEECLEELKGAPLHILPEVIFMDLEMPGLNGIQTIASGKTLYPQIHFIVLTVFDDDEKIFEAIKAGASGYLLKHENASSLMDAVKNVLESGGAPMSPAIARKALQMLSKSSQRKNYKESFSIPETISEREKEILQYTVSGLDAKRTADILKISVFTVRKHIANIYEKLHVQSKAQVISLAHNNRWFNV
ncbi:MAG: response regulator transcription factor [Chitinophagales bacterium]|nr:response regulator transcription factor [Chitinophagales bacterium]